MVCSRKRAAFRQGVTMVTSSRSDVAGIEAPGDSYVGGSLDDGAAVGENHQFIRIEGDAQGEFVRADGRESAQARGEIGEIQGAGAFVDLHGVAAAEADGDAAGAV